MNLIIVESPTKARTISKFLGGKYKILASFGHLRDLPQKTLGIAIKIKNEKLKTKNVQPQYEFVPQYTIEGKERKETARVLTEEAKKAEKVYLATDPDREGEAIAWHIGEILRQAQSSCLPAGTAKLKAQSFRRIAFHEITEIAIRAALESPHEINMGLVDAQQARRVLDRLVGYKLSPLLWAKVRKGLSAGRVQSVALRLIVEREREIEKFRAEEFWRLAACFQNGVSAELFAKNNEKYEKEEKFSLFDGEYTVTKTSIDKEKVEELTKTLAACRYVVNHVERRDFSRFPGPPFTTSTLQQEAGRKLFFSAKRTMQAAQRLYEEGLITYHRTDSVNLASEAIERCRQYILEGFGKDYLPSTPRIYRTKSKVAQEAHEAIRPTNVKKEAVSESVGRDEARLYVLIWRKFVACQMREAMFEQTNAEILAGSAETADKYLFRASGLVRKFPGFLRVYEQETENKPLPKMTVGEELKFIRALSSQHFTGAPPRYTEAALIKTLEEKSIGRPSTYAPTISTITERNYVEILEKKFRPTVLGIAVNDFLVRYFSDVVNIPFTAKMEDSLDEIANGKTLWMPVISSFYGPFEEKLATVFKEAERAKIEVLKTSEPCPKCGEMLVVRVGKFGKFLACAGFPKCRFTKPLAQKTGIICPKCGGEVIIKKTRSRKTFYGCSNYPKCDFSSWTKPAKI